MEAFERRPLGTFASAFYIFSCVISCISADGRMWTAVLLFAVFAFVLLAQIKFPFKRAVTVVVAGMLAAAVFSVYTVDVRMAEIQSLSGEERSIDGTVLGVRYTSSYEGCYTVKTDGMKIVLKSDNCELAVGDMIRCTVLYDSLDISDDGERYIISDGIVMSCTSIGDVFVIERDHDADVSFAGLRRGLSAKLRSGMSAESGGFAAALLLGDRTHLADEVARDFRFLGISHILALSGTHLTMLFSFVGGCFSSKRRFSRMLVLCPAVLFYMLLTGFSPSVVRAGIMFIIASVSSVCAKRADSFTSLSVAVLLICILNPYSLFDTGLMLSYSAVMGLVISSELQRVLSLERTPATAKALGILIPSFAVPAVLLPLMWITFGEMSLVSPLANIVLAPIVSLFIPLLAILLLLSWMPVVFIPLSSAADALISGTLKVVRLIAVSVDPMLPLKGAVSLAALLLFVLFAVISVLLSPKGRSLAVHLCVMFLCFTLVSAQLYSDFCKRGMTVYYSASKTDEAVYVISEGYNILIDMGRYTAALGDAAKRGSDHGSGKIDTLILTDLNKSHILALAEISSNYYLDSLWLPADSDSDIAHSLKSEAENRGIEVYSYIPDEHLAFGDCVFETPSLNGSTVSFSLEYDGKRISYSAAPDIDSYSDVNIIGVHDAKISGILPGGFGKVIVPTAAAAEFETVSVSAFVTDTVAVRFSRGQAPVIIPQG